MNIFQIHLCLLLGRSPQQRFRCLANLIIIAPLLRQWKRGRISHRRQRQQAFPWPDSYKEIWRYYLTETSKMRQYRILPFLLANRKSYYTTHIASLLLEPSHTPAKYEMATIFGLTYGRLIVKFMKVRATINWKEFKTSVQQLVRLLFNNNFINPGLVL